MSAPYLEGCSKQKWIANEKSFKNPTRTSQDQGLVALAMGVSREYPLNDRSMK